MLTSHPLIQAWLFGSAAVFGFLALLPLQSRGASLFPRLFVSSLLGFAFINEYQRQAPSVLELLMVSLAGVLIALPLVCVVELFRSSALIVESTRGQSFSAFFTLSSDSGSSGLPLLVHFGVMSYLFSSGLFIEAFAGLSRVTEISLSAPSLLAVVYVLSSTLTSVVWGVAPLAALLVTIDLSLGLLSRQMPKLVLIGEAITLKTFAFLLALFLMEYAGIASALSEHFQQTAVLLRRP